MTQPFPHRRAAAMMAPPPPVAGALKSRARAFSYQAGAAPGLEIRAAADGGAEILLYDEIGYWGVTARMFVEQLAAVTAKRIALRINSPGGDVFDAMAMFNALRRHPAEITATIDGLAASAASVVMLAGDRVEIAESAMVMIHDPWGVVLGSGDEMRDFAAVLDKITGQIAGIYIARTGQDADIVADWMKAETWFTGAEAEAAGFADAVIPNPTGGAAEALTRWDLRAFLNPPADSGERRSPDPDDDVAAAATPPRPHLAALRRELDIGRLRD